MLYRSLLVNLESEVKCFVPVPSRQLNISGRKDAFAEVVFNRLDFLGGEFEDRFDGRGRFALLVFDILLIVFYINTRVVFGDIEGCLLWNKWIQAIEGLEQRGLSGFI